MIYWTFFYLQDRYQPFKTSANFHNFWPLSQLSAILANLTIFLFLSPCCHISNYDTRVQPPTLKTSLSNASNTKSKFWLTASLQKCVHINHSSQILISMSSHLCKWNDDYALEDRLNFSLWVNIRHLCSSEILELNFLIPIK